MNGNIKGKSVLIIDENIHELRVIIGMLKSAGLVVMPSLNGKDGIAKCGLVGADLIISEISLPDMSGLAVLRRVKANPVTATVPFVFMSSSADLDIKIEAFREGAVDYITKPAYADEVLLRAEVHIRQSSIITQIDSSNAGSIGLNIKGDDAIFQACIELIDKKLSSPLSVDRLADMVGTHRKRLTDIFKDRCGLTVFEYLSSKRMECAKKYLEDNQLSIQGIADLLGYTSAANFATAFKQKFLVTPTEYRKLVNKSIKAASHNGHRPTINDENMLSEITLESPKANYHFSGYL